MKNLNKTLFTVLTLMIASQAFATSSLKPLVNCRVELPAADFGYTVEVSQYTGPIVLNKGPISSLIATVEEMTIAGERRIISTNVKQLKVDPRRLGAPRVYKGKNFNLEILVDVAPINGKVRAHLTAQAENRQISEDLVCDLK